MKRKWSLDDAPSQEGKIVLVTGGNSGLGYESVKMFASKGATVIMASRSLKNAAHAIEMILRELPTAKINPMTLDLASLTSIESFAKAFIAKYKRLDILLNNAGIMNVPYGQTSDGFELQLGVNHLGHFALTGHLFSLLIATPNARIVNISSLMHKRGKIDFNNLMFDQGQGYTPEVAYAQSKLANLLFTNELDRRIKENQLNIKVLAAHPGGASTNLGRYSKETITKKILKQTLYKLLMQSARDGAMSGIRASIDSDAKSGMYLGPSGFMESSGQPYITQAANSAYDVETAKFLWQISEQLTGVKYKFT